MKKLVAALVVIFVLAMPAGAIEPPRLSVSSRYELNADSQEVRSTHTIVPASTGEFSLLLPVTGVRDVRLHLVGKDDPIEFKSEETTVVRLGSSVKATSFRFNLTQKKTVELDLVTDSLVKKTGKSTIFALPPQPAGEARIDSVELIVPVSRGLAVSYGVKPSDTSIGSGQQSYRFEAKGDGIDQIMMLFGTATTAQAKWERRLKNGSWWWRTEKFILPPDTNQQTVFLKSLNPKPTNLGVDKDGNLIAEYRIGPKKSLIVNAEAAISLKSVGYNTTNTRTLADIPEQLKGYAVNDGSRPDDAVVLDVATTVYQAVLEQIKEAQSALGQSQIMAETAEKLRKGGVPTRLVEGVKLVNAGQVADTFVRASWVEIFAPGVGWMSLDPFSEQYGQSDFTRVGLLIKSPVSQVNETVSTDGLELNYSDEVIGEPDFSQTNVKLVKYPLVPGISLAKMVVVMPPGTVLDGAAAAGAGVQTVLGSLAPLQTVNRWSMLIGGNAFSKGEVQFGRGGDNGIGEILAKGEVSINWLFAALEIIFLILITVIIIKWRRTGTGMNAVPRLRHQYGDSDIETENLLKDRS